MMIMKIMMIMIIMIIMIINNHLHGVHQVWQGGGGQTDTVDSVHFFRSSFDFTKDSFLICVNFKVLRPHCLTPNWPIVQFWSGFDPFNNAWAIFLVRATLHSSSLHFSTNVFLTHLLWKQWQLNANSRIGSEKNDNLIRFQEFVLKTMIIKCNFKNLLWKQW